jgi:hypothetical protein
MKIIVLLFILLSSVATAQKRIRVETPFNTFIKSPTILWAINANDTLRFANLNLSALLVQKMYKGEIKTAWTFGNDSKEENNLMYRTIAENDMMLNGAIHVVPMYDREGSLIATKTVKNKLDSISSLIEINQKIYIENDKLHSYISYVSPIKTIITAQGLNLGDAAIFSAAFNYEYNTNDSPNDKVILLGNSRRVFEMDSISKFENCKEILGKNLIESLLPSIENNKISLYSYPENKKVNFEFINSNYLNKKESHEIPVFDSTGYQTGTIHAVNEFKPNVFNKITITQEWYYNETKNIVFCKIPSAILSIPKLNEADTTAHEIKIVF